MKTLILTAVLISAVCMLVEAPPARAWDLDDPVFRNLALPDSILPPGFYTPQGRLFPGMGNPAVTMEQDIIEVICISFLMSFRDEEAIKSLGSGEGVDLVERFSSALSSYVRAGYMALYYPPPGQDLEEVMVQALLLRPECTMLDNMTEGIFMERMMFLRNDTLAVYAFSDVDDDKLVKSMLDHLERQVKE